MTANKRIVLNIAANYGRSLFAMACGVFSTRWVLMALGQTDMGLYGLVGSLTMLVSFFNIQLATAISRYFAYAIGEARVAQNAAAGLEECRRWFNVAVFIHTVVPLALVLVGGPVGEYLIRHGYFVIPADRVSACVWVWRYCCIGCLIGMVNVPFQGMYTAKQYIAELTVYNVVQTAVRTAFIYLMVVCPGDWLTKYAFGVMIIGIVPQLLICLRAIQVFPECRFTRAYMMDWLRIRKVVEYVLWQVVGSFGYVARTSGVSIVANRFFGPSVNAAMGVGNTLAAETAVLTGALSGAFSPAITTACGAGDLTYMRQMAYRTCKFGTMLTLLFALPLVLEVEKVLELWLKTPPDGTVELAIALTACIVVEKLTLGHTIAVNASGRLAKYQTVHGLAMSLALPLSAVACWLYADVWSIGYALVAAMSVSAIGDVVVARRVVGLDMRYWARRIVWPIVVASLGALVAGLLPRLMMAPSFSRIVVTSFLSFLTACGLGYVVVLDGDERTYLKTRVTALRSRIRGGMSE